MDDAELEALALELLATLTGPFGSPLTDAEDKEAILAALRRVRAACRRKLLDAAARLGFCSRRYYFREAADLIAPETKEGGQGPWTR